MKLINLAKKYNYICYWCKKKFLLEDLSRDHIITGKRRKGTKRQRGPMVLACIFCNQERGNLPFEVFKHRKVKIEKKYVSPYYTLDELEKPSRFKK